VSLRFVFYGRLSTTDKQDPALSFPSQRKACERKAQELHGSITCEFTDQESGAKADRLGWSQLMAEAANRDGRRFDAVVIYNTARLSRDRLHAGLFERELRKAGVPIHYATGGGDPTTAEGRVMIGIQQLFDQFERDKLARETKRGMTEATEQGYRAGGRAPYGYRRVLTALPETHRGDRSKSRVTLEADPDQAPGVAEIFHLHADRGYSPKAIADHLNRLGGPPTPQHVDSRRNVRGTGRRARSGRCCATRPTPAGWCGIASTSRPPVRTGTEERGSAPRRSGWCPSRRTHRSSPRPPLPRARRDSSSARGARPRASATGVTCSPAWCTAPPATSP
jgi:DNA invertase Pin-like site-specific DNA recombinase